MLFLHGQAGGWLVAALVSGDSTHNGDKINVRTLVGGNYSYMCHAGPLYIASEVTLSKATLILVWHCKKSLPKK